MDKERRAFGLNHMLPGTYREMFIVTTEITPIVRPCKALHLIASGVAFDGRGKMVLPVKINTALASGR